VAVHVDNYNDQQPSPRLQPSQCPGQRL